MICRSVLELYINEVQDLGMRIMGLLGEALKIEKRELEVFEDGIQNLRMTYYPPCPEPELVMGLSAHSDASGITILNQMNGVNGLQIKKDGAWIPVNVISDALVVNIGDILEVCMDPYSSLSLHSPVLFITFYHIFFFQYFFWSYISLQYEKIILIYALNGGLGENGAR